MDKRITRVAQVLLDREPDLILFQEIWFKGDADRMTRELASKYERVRIDQDMACRLLCWAAGFRKSGLLAFRWKESKWGVKKGISFQEFTAHATRWRFWQADGVSGKGFQRFELQASEVRIVVFNAHLQSPYWRGEDLFCGEYPYVEEREKQINQIVAQIVKEDPSAAVIVVGDFNTTPGTHREDVALYKQLTTDLRDLTTGYRAKNPSGTLLSKQTGWTDWIDYVFSRQTDGTVEHPESIRLIRNSDTIDCPYSDHHGVEAKLWPLPTMK